MDTQPAPLKVTHFEKADRDRIRRQLLRYMEENRIGVPTLQKLIARANGYADHDYIQLKTLQRFLADKHRSNDTFIGLCARFAGSLPDDDPVADLGDTLVRFMRGKAPAGDDGDGRAFPGDVLGAYDGALDTPSPPAGKPYSRLTVDRLIATPFAAVEEIVHGGRSSARDAPAAGVWRVYEGVMVQPGGRFFALMRNTLTGAPRTYNLTVMRLLNPRTPLLTLKGVGYDDDDIPATPSTAVAGVAGAAGPIPIKVTFLKVLTEPAP